MIDHHHRFADDGPRTLANLGPLCDDHDHRKTHDRWILVRHGRSRRLVPPDHPLAVGATPGGCIDLDDDGVDAEPTIDATGGEAKDDASSASARSDQRPGQPNDTGKAPQAHPGEPAQLDLLAG
ncbi:MAG: hypothetical protein U0Q07_10805 [Acidimicrobiales bacterium]